MERRREGRKDKRKLKLEAGRKGKKEGGRREGRAGEFTVESQL